MRLNERRAISYSSQPSKKSNTFALNRPCAIIEKWSQPGRRHGFRAGNRLGQPLRRSGKLVALTRDHQSRSADREQRIARDLDSRSARAGGQRQPVFLLLVGEVAKAFQHRIGDLVRRGHFHRPGHRVGLARRLEDLAADTRDDEMVDTAAIDHRGGEGDVRTHREAQQVRALDAGMIHQGEHVLGHLRAIVLRCLMRLGAFAMAAAVER